MKANWPCQESGAAFDGAAQHVQQAHILRAKAWLSWAKKASRCSVRGRYAVVGSQRLVIDQLAKTPDGRVLIGQPEEQQLLQDDRAMPLTAGLAGEILLGDLLTAVDLRGGEVLDECQEDLVDIRGPKLLRRRTSGHRPSPGPRATRRYAAMTRWQISSTSPIALSSPALTDNSGCSAASRVSLIRCANSRAALKLAKITFPLREKNVSSNP